MCKSLKIFLLAFSVLLLTQSSVFSQKKNSNDKYKLRTLDEIIELNRDGTDQIFKSAKLSDALGFIGIDPYYSRVKLEYVGTPKSISPEIQGFLKTWGKLQRADKKFLDLYENVFLFKEGQTEYWIPVQKGSAQSLDANVKAGDMIDLFVIYIGAKKEANVKDFYSVFLSTGYER